jgi:hypothetical protein
MARQVGGVVAGLVVWVAAALVVGEIMRASWPAYAIAAPALAFTLPMKLARLAIGAVSTLAAGWVTAFVARSPTAVLITGAILLALFIPQHISLWDKFPIWYHIAFLASLVPLTFYGGTLVASSRHPHAH